MKQEHNIDNPIHRLFVPSLFIAFFSTMSPGIISGLLLIDISDSFNSSIGIVSQMRTASSFLGIFSALIIGVLSTRYDPKRILIVGLAIIGVVGLGCGLSTSLAIMFLAYSLVGIGNAMTSPMVTTMIGLHLPLERRPSAIGWLTAGGSLAYLIGSPTISYLKTVGGWRLPFLIYLIPLILIAIFMTQISVPRRLEKSGGNMGLMEGIREIYRTKSALACLLGVMLSSVCWQGLVYFATSFFRQRFQLTIFESSLVLAATALFFTIGSILSGRFVSRWGRKKMTMLGSILLGVCTALFTFMSHFWVSASFAAIGCFFGGIRYASADGLTLEQVPGFRETLMAMNTASTNTGYLLGSALGGFMLLNFNWNVLQFCLGIFGLISTIIYWRYAKDDICG
jgi:DHA1 family inner membrane transport protein